MAGIYPNGGGHLLAWAVWLAASRGLAMGGSVTAAAPRLGGYSPLRMVIRSGSADTGVAAGDDPGVRHELCTARVRRDRLLSGHQHRGVRRGIRHSCSWSSWSFLRLLAVLAGPGVTDMVSARPAME